MNRSLALYSALLGCRLRELVWLMITYVRNIMPYTLQMSEQGEDSLFIATPASEVSRSSASVAKCETGRELARGRIHGFTGEGHWGYAPSIWCPCLSAHARTATPRLALQAHLSSPKGCRPARGPASTPHCILIGDLLMSLTARMWRLDFFGGLM